jgi:hypothetical protein
MVDERDDKYEMQEEGEYHFSDDHASYEVDTDTTKVADVAVAKPSPLANMSRYKRVLIAGVVFIILMFIVYKMVAPSGLSAPNTDIAQQAAPPVASSAKAVAPKPTLTTPAPAVAQAPAPVAAPQPIQQPPQSQQTASVTMPQPQMNVPQQLPTPAAAPVMQAPVIAQQNVPPAPVQQQGSGGTVNYAQSDNKELADRLAALEQQNAKLTNVLQMEYAQKMTDYENQSAALQSKLRDLGSRVANMEAALNQITQLLQGGTSKQISMSQSASSPTGSSGPKQNYTVQAIIPGRAWLKSDAGDTVTVAEGDVLRDYGRITKIDPYDGVVDIDTGNKVISLSYGAGGES